MSTQSKKPIFLINPGSFLSRSWIYRELMFPVPPMSIAYLAGALENEGWPVIIEDQFATGVSNKKLAERIAGLDPLLVGISCLTPAMGSVRELVGYLKTLGVRAPVVMGNTHAHTFYEAILKEKLADIVVFGEGEQRIVRVAKAIDSGRGLEDIPDISYMEDDKVVSRKAGELLEDLEDLSYPLWDKLDLANYSDFPLLMIHEPVLSIQASRGCPYSCTFCSQDKTYKRPRFRKPDAIITEMEYMHKRYGIGFMGFNDSYFPHAHDSGMEFCKLWNNSSLPGNMRWFTESRVNLVDEELLMAMSKSDCEMIMYGFESGNQEVLDSISKMATLKQARETMAATKKAGLRSVGFFIVGLPGETRETIEQTISFALELNPDMAKFNIFVPLPGSAAFNEYWSESDYTAEPERFTSWSLFVGKTKLPPYVPEGMTTKELDWLQKKAMMRFFLRPSKILSFLQTKMLTWRNLGIGALVFAHFILTRLRILKAE